MTARITVKLTKEQVEQIAAEHVDGESIIAQPFVKSADAEKNGTMTVIMLPPALARAVDALCRGWKSYTRGPGLC